MESRFSYKEWLSEYSLDVKLFEAYDLNVMDVIPLRKVFILVSDKGNKILKKTNCSEEDLQFIKTSIDYLKRQGFKNAMEFVINKEGHIFTKWKGQTYIVMDLIEGRECEYNNPLDIRTAIKSLGEMHRASKNIEFPQYTDRFQGFKLQDNYMSKLRDLEKMKTRSLEYEYRNEFHEIFLSNVDYFLECMRQSIDIIKSSSYIELCKNKENYALCHHDLAYHNILIKDNQGYFIDFDYSIIDLRIHDLCNIINKSTKYSCYDFEILKLIIDEYNAISPLKKEEYEVLYGMLRFPEGFYSISRDYFYRKKLWAYESFVYKIDKKVQNIDERDEMLQNFKNQYL